MTDSLEKIQGRIAQLLAMAAEHRAEELEKTFGPLRGMVTSRKALDRAYYLGEQLKEVCWDELGVAGRLVDELDAFQVPKHHAR